VIADRRAVAKPDDRDIHICRSHLPLAHPRGFLVPGLEVRHVHDRVPGPGHRPLRGVHKRPTHHRQPPQLRGMTQKHPARTRRLRHTRQHPSHPATPPPTHPSTGHTSLDITPRSSADHRQTCHLDPQTTVRAAAPAGKSSRGRVTARRIRALIDRSGPAPGSGGPPAG
jgi:hypothetical protein